MGVKRRTINMLTRLSIILSYKIINTQRGQLAKIRKVPDLLYTHPFNYLASNQWLILIQRRLHHLAQARRDQVIISWDNFDYSEGVRHQTLREPAKHISATTGKLCIGHYIPIGGLYKLMLRYEVALDPCDILLATSNQEDEIRYVCQRYQIAEGIRYTYREAIEDLFTNSSPNTIGQKSARVTLIGWPEFPLVNRLTQRKTPYYGLGPILENKGTISGIYNVINNIFLLQLKYNQEDDFNRRLYLVYGN